MNPLFSNLINFKDAGVEESCWLCTSPDRIGACWNWTSNDFCRCMSLVGDAAILFAPRIDSYLDFVLVRIDAFKLFVNTVMCLMTKICAQGHHKKPAAILQTGRVPNPPEILLHSELKYKTIYHSQVSLSPEITFQFQSLWSLGSIATNPKLYDEELTFHEQSQALNIVKNLVTLGLQMWVISHGLKSSPTYEILD